MLPCLGAMQELLALFLGKDHSIIDSRWFGYMDICPTLWTANNYISSRPIYWAGAITVVASMSDFAYIEPPSVPPCFGDDTPFSV